MQYQWEYGDQVRVIRNVRNDGTFPGMEPGELLIRRGSIGYVVDVGTFLQDQVIYSIHFLDAGRIVGCREEELIDISEAWVPSRYEFREKVASAINLSVGGELLVPQGAVGEVIKVIREEGAETASYHIHFECLKGRLLAIPERLLEPVVLPAVAAADAAVQEADHA
jgi:nitrogen fixation protein NifZ